MPRILSFLTCLLVTGGALLAQTPPPSVQATGSATVSANPDQATLTIGVVTQGTTAQDAAQQNATISNNVQTAIKSVLGSNGMLQTISYYVTQRYSNSQPPSLIGYSVTNTVLVTSYNLSNLGSLIDTAYQAGANSMGGINFGLRNPDPFQQQALNQAAKQALAHAGAIAAGLGLRTGAVLSAGEGYSYTPTAVAGPTGGVATTPIQTGLVSVSASVTVSVLLVQ